jgi:hypothetical protein
MTEINAKQFRTDGYEEKSTYVSLYGACVSNNFAHFTLFALL